MPADAAPPTRLNLALLALASAASGALLWAASHAPSAWITLACAVAFSFTANTLFSLLHESVHGTFAAGPRLDRWAGRVAALWFPTALGVQRAYHLTHHRQNRSPSEQFDVWHDGDVRWLKYAQWYAIYTGLYWWVALAGLLLYGATPAAPRRWLVDRLGARGAGQTGADQYAAALEALDPVTTRLEVLAAVAFHGALLPWLGVGAGGWLACYAAFGLSWSSLQYTDHAFSPLDARRGAWNLRVHPWVRAVFLNYHLHLAHHERPELPWTALPRVATDGPRFWTVWRAAWGGPRRPEAFPTFPTGPVL